MRVKLAGLKLTPTDRQVIDTIKTSIMANINQKNWIEVYEDVKVNGIKNPMCYDEENTSCYRLIRGHTRYACAEILGIEEVEVLFPEDPEYKEALKL